MIDKDCQERFGGGRLQDYAINSNTEGRKFVTNITKDKSDTIPPEMTSNTCLESLRQKDSGTRVPHFIYIFTYMNPAKCCDVVFMVYTCN